MTERVHRPGSFTLIELLVLVTIIAILAAMLLPALSQARGRARTVACISNMRQFGMAFINYADDFNGAVMPHRFKHAYYWTHEMKEYAGTEVGPEPGIHCPEEASAARSYATNGYLHTNIHNPPTPPAKVRYFRQFKKPEATMSVLDSNHAYQNAWDNAIGSPAIQLRHENRFCLLYFDMHAERYAGQIQHGANEYIPNTDKTFWNGNLGWYP